MLILDWKLVSNSIKINLKNYFQENHFVWKYVAIFLLQDHVPSKVYVNLKKKFANEVWLNFFIFWWFGSNDLPWNYDYLKPYLDTDCSNVKNILKIIDFLNADPNCVWEVVQLPLPDFLVPHKAQILSRVSPTKDPDWLWWNYLGLSAINLVDFIPATPNAVIKILEHYNLADFEWKNVTIIWQSNLVWKPLAMEIIKRRGEVFTFNDKVDINLLKDVCKKSDYIISATWKINLIDETFLSWNSNQILVDVWWGIKDGKAVWDVNFELVKDKVYAITPVPWWIGPVTVASLFDNIRVLDSIEL